MGHSSSSHEATVARNFLSGAIIHHVCDKLGVCLCLVPPSHDAEPDVNLVLLHERRNNRVQRTLAPGQRIRQPRRQLKSRAAVLKGKTEPGSDHSRAVARVVTLDQRNDISVLVDCRKVDRRIAVSVEHLLDVGRNHFARGLIHLDESRTLLRQVFESISFTGTGVNADRRHICTYPSLPDPEKLVNAGLGGTAWRAIDLFEGDKINERALKNLVRFAVDYNQIKLKRKAPAGTRAKV